MPVVQPCSLSCGRGLCPGGTQPTPGEESQAGGLGDAGPHPRPLAQLQGVCLNDTPDHRLTALAASKGARVAPQRAG